MRVDALTKEVIFTEDEYKKLTDASKIKVRVVRDKDGKLSFGGFRNQQFIEYEYI